MHINDLTALTVEEQDKIFTIMRSFDFHSVKRAMTKMNWKWGDAIPSLYDLMSAAESLMINAVQTLNIMEIGGFRATYKDAEIGGLRATYKNAEISLSFNIERKEA